MSDHIKNEHESRLTFLIRKYLTEKEENGVRVLPLLQPTELYQIIVADPTSSIEYVEGDELQTADLTKVNKVGKYTQWILSHYEKLEDVLRDLQCADIYLPDRERQVFFEDLYKVKNDLSIYDRIKRKKNVLSQENKDINNVPSFHALYELTRDFDESLTMSKVEWKEKVIQKDLVQVYDGEKWEVVIPQSHLAAVTISGPPLTRWCTSTETSSNYFQTYINQSPLYILRDKKDIIDTGRGKGHPRPLYQFHFKTGTFMNKEDQRIEIVDFMNDNPELKTLFKQQFKDQHLNQSITTVKYPRDNVSKFIAIYGFEEFFECLPTDITDLDIDCSDAYIEFELPKNIVRFKKLESLYLQSCVSHIPEEIGQLKNLQNFSVPNNRHLKTLPRSLSTIGSLLTINVRGCKLKIPEELIMLDESDKILIIQN